MNKELQQFILKFRESLLNYYIKGEYKINEDGLDILILATLLDLSQ